MVSAPCTACLQSTTPVNCASHGRADLDAVWRERVHGRADRRSGAHRRSRSSRAARGGGARRELGFSTAPSPSTTARARRAARRDACSCAGPFSATSAVVDACLAARASYLDITGEISVFEAVLARDAEAKRAGVSLIPGVGFDVVPTDCVAAAQGEAPRRDRLELAFAAIGTAAPARPSHDRACPTAAIRRDGRIRVCRFWRAMDVPFRDTRGTVTIPWGDISTAFTRRGSQHRDVHGAAAAAGARASRGAPAAAARDRRGQRRLMARIERTVKGRPGDARHAALASLGTRPTPPGVLSVRRSGARGLPPDPR